MMMMMITVWCGGGGGGDDDNDDKDDDDNNKELEKIDWKMRKLLTTEGTHHLKADVNGLYIVKTKWWMWISRTWVCI